MSYIWENTIDNNTYHVAVEDAGENKGKLIVTEVATSNVLHEEIVPLAYGAIFGPDVDDVNSWQDKVINVIDNPEQRTTLG